MLLCIPDCQTMKLAPVSFWAHWARFPLPIWQPVCSTLQPELSESGNPDPNPGGCDLLRCDAHAPPVGGFIEYFSRLIITKTRDGIIVHLLRLNLRYNIIYFLFYNLDI